MGVFWQLSIRRAERGIFLPPPDWSTFEHFGAQPFFHPVDSRNFSQNWAHSILEILKNWVLKMKVAKAKKSTHKKGKAQKQIRGKVLRTTKHDPNAEYEIAVSTSSQKF